MGQDGPSGARPWPERPVSAANKSGKDHAAPRRTADQSALALGPIGDRVLFEDGHIRVWEMVLEPGERSPLHRHENDYVVVVVEGDHVTVEPLEDGDGGSGSKSSTVTPGQSIFLRKGSTEVALNSGAARYRDVQIELLGS